MFVKTWLLPFALLVTATIVAIPLSRYMAWIMDGKYRPLPILGWFEKHLDSGSTELEAVYRFAASFQYVAVCLRLSGADAATLDAVEP